MFTDDLQIAGQLTIRQYDRADRLVAETRARNAITLGGRALVARLFNLNKRGDTIQRVSLIRLGTSQEPFQASQTNLLSPIGSTPIKTIEELQTIDGANQQRVALRLTGELGEADCNGQLREAALFTEDGVMYNRVTFDTITKSDKFKLTLIWDITF